MWHQHVASEHDKQFNKVTDTRQAQWGFTSFGFANLAGQSLITFGDPLVPASVASRGSWFISISPAAMMGREGAGVLTYLDKEVATYNKSIAVTSQQPLLIKNKG